MSLSPKSVLIVGGGTAGWMTACFLAKTWKNTGIKIQLLESDSIGTIGVGEGSTPYLKQFFDFLGVTETDWMQYCDATYKMGISFEDWASPQGSKSYFHPFFSELDIPTATQFFSNVNKRRQGFSADVSPAHYFVAAEMVRQNIMPNQLKEPVQLDYAYHFDAGKLGLFLKQVALELGVEHTIGTVSEVSTQNGLIQSVITKEQHQITAELFVDCSGFRGLLSKQALNRQFTSYSDTLFNDSAVAIPTSLNSNELIKPQTRSVALKSGWMWDIPLTTRRGNGYVYSSKFCTPDQAETELRDTLGVDDSVSARHLKMQVGRLEQHWSGNCLSIGLSQGFIEPLEATALMLVQYALHHFVDCWQSDQQSDIYVRYNQEMNRMFDGIRDYIAAHYYLNTRTDSAYWIACREDIKVPHNLDYLVQSWDQGHTFEDALNRVAPSLVYLRPSWYCILAGMERFNLATVPLEAHNHDVLRNLKSTTQKWFD